MTAKIALFANRESRQLAEIGAAVSAEGGIPVMLDIQIGGDSAPAVSMSRKILRWGGVDFSDIHAVHVRCQAPRVLPILPPLLNDVSWASYRLQYVKEQVYQSITYSFFEHLAAEGRLVANRLTGAYVDHNSKSQLYPKLSGWGFPVPRTISTNVPDAFRAFRDEVGECVVKPAIGIGSTRLVTAEDDERLDELSLCPALFQERIKGETLRVHIVGGTVVLVLRIIAEGVDSRTGTKDFELSSLTTEQSECLVSANRSLSLHYSAWDVIRDSNGNIYYLDCNPGPYVMWLHEEQRRFVFMQLARYLIKFSESRSVSRAEGSVEPFQQ